MASRTKPLILHYYQDFHSWGGIMTFLLETLPRIQAEGQYDLAFLGTENSPLYYQLQELGIPVYGIPHTPLDAKIRRWCPLESLYPELHLMRYWGKVNRILETLKPDIIHTHLGEGEHFRFIETGIPVVRTFHGTIYKASYHGQNPLKLRYHQWCLSRLSKLAESLAGMTIISHYEYDVLKAEKCLPKSLASVIHNGIDISKFKQRVTRQDASSFRRELGLPEDAIVIGFFCRLDADKNAKAFLEIAQQVRQELLSDYPLLAEKTHFLVAGSGSLSELFQQECSNNPLLQGYAHYLGYRNDIPDLLNITDFTIDLSLDEGFGLRILESLIMGRPCIAFNTGGIPEVLTVSGCQESGDWLIETGNNAKMVEAVISMLQLPQAKLKALTPVLQGHAERFDISNQIEALNRFYCQILTKNIENVQ